MDNQAYTNHVVNTSTTELVMVYRVVFGDRLSHNNTHGDVHNFRQLGVIR